MQRGGAAASEQSAGDDIRFGFKRLLSRARRIPAGVLILREPLLCLITRQKQIYI